MGCAAATRVEHHAQPSVIIDNDYGPSVIDDKRNLEPYYLFWLDRTVRSPEYIEMHAELRSIIDYLKIFESNQECQEKFRNITNGKIFFLVNYAESLTILPYVHDHPQLYSIYIYQDGSNIDTKDLKIKYKKIRGIYDSFLTVKRYLEDDIAIHTTLDDPIVTDFSAEYQEKFSLFLKTIYANETNTSNQKIRKQLITMCMKYYDDNEKETSLLKEFTHSYKSEQAITWYMKDFCLHRLLSQAFNDHDMSLLVDMYPFIADINRNIQQQSKNQPSSLSLHLFRGQIISNEKFELLKNNLNQLITMQCFFLAYTSRDETFRTLESIECNEMTMRRIIFEIDAFENYTFVDSSQSSTSKTAVLFMLGTMFKIVDVTETTIVLSQNTLYPNKNYDLVNESPVILQGILIYLKDGGTEAIEYFEKLLKDRSTDILALSSSIDGQLGYLKQKAGNSQGATSMYEQAMTCGINEINLYLYYLDQTAQHYAFVLNDWQKAETVWLRKLNIENACSLKQETIRTYENLIRTALETEQYSKIVEYTSAVIGNLPVDHPQLLFFQEQLENARKKTI